MIIKTIFPVNTSFVFSFGLISTTVSEVLFISGLIVPPDFPLISSEQLYLRSQANENYYY